MYPLPCYTDISRSELPVYVIDCLEVFCKSLTLFGVSVSEPSLSKFIPGSCTFSDTSEKN